MGLANYFVTSEANAKARDSVVINYGTFRFSILTERLIRIEYSKTSTFEDRPTARVISRTFDKPLFQVDDTEATFQIKTSYFQLILNKKKSTIKDAIEVKLLNSDKTWFYGHPEVRNFGGINVSLDDFKPPLKLEKGMYSTDGFVTLDDSKSEVLNGDEFVAREEGNVDVYLFMYRKDLGLCLKDYFGLTGMPNLVPRYAFGNWWYKNEEYTNDSIKSLVEEFKFNDIPISIMLLGSKWHMLQSEFIFNPEKLDGKELSTFLNKENIRFGLTIGPTFRITKNDPTYNEIVKYVEPGKNGAELLPFSKTTLGIYFNMYIKYLENLGVEFFNIDYSGELNTLWKLEHYHFAHADASEKKRGFILSRNSLITPHRYPIMYTGKTLVTWDTLSNLPFYNLSASNIGASFLASAVGGYYLGIEDPELYMRYIQFSCYSAFFILASEGGKYYKREPWRHENGTFRIAADYMRFRHQLIPYIYSESYAYHKTGAPLTQPLYYKYPQIYDEPTYRSEYFFGSQLFVAPITKKKDIIINRVIQRLFIPNGMWYDFKTGKKFPGGNYYVSFFRDEDYPVFCKAGGIVVLSNNYKSTSLPTDLEIHIFPGENNNYKLYEDDGISNLYKQNYYLLTLIDYNYRANNYTVIIRPIDGKTGIVPPKRNYKIRFRNTKEAEEVFVYQGETQVEFTKYIEENDFVVEVNNIDTLGQLTINCKGKDIEIDAVRLINDEIAGILNDLMIETSIKEKIDAILFSDDSIQRKRIEIRKLSKYKLEPKYIKMFIKLLEYINQI